MDLNWSFAPDAQRVGRARFFALRPIFGCRATGEDVARPTGLNWSFAPDARVPAGS